MTTIVDSAIFNPPVEPPVIMPSIYGPPVRPLRGRDIPGMVSLRVRDLFPDIPPTILQDRQDGAPMRRATLDALAHVDMDMIKPSHRVHVLCSEHGFGIDGGFPYANMLAAIRDEIVSRTGCQNVKLVVIAWHGRKEPDEFIEYYGLDDMYHGKTVGANPLDAGIKIDTVLGPLYGIRTIYNADWIIHTHYDDPREVYAHRAIDRITKPFGMSYARMETRSIFHLQMGPRTGNLIGRALADSEFVRSKLAFSVVMQSSPDGLTGVDADNDIDKVGARTMTHMLRSYGKMLALLRTVEDCIPIIDGARWPYYIHAGGMIFGQLFFNGRDWWDLDLPDDTADLEHLIGGNVSLGIKALVLNHTLIGLGVLALPMVYPTVIADRAMADVMARDFANADFLEYAEVADNLFEAVEMARERADGSNNLMCFDGSYGAINLTRSMGEQLLANAPECSRLVDEDLLPKYLKQRGLDPMALGVGSA
jgi:hypothetical protein